MNTYFMQTTLTDPSTYASMPMLNTHQYDQLNRLLESRSYESGLTNNQWNPTAYNNEYYNAFTYDAMGNILTQKRHLRNGTTQIDDIRYRYEYDSDNDLIRNRLYLVNDNILNTVDPSDVDDMGTQLFTTSTTNINGDNNYVYDEEGRLIKDVQEGIDRIIWRVDGKVKEIHRPLNSTKKNVSFDYDAMGNRIAKHVFDDNWNLEKSTYYILDAQGNQMSMYEHEVQSGGAVDYTLAERNIYGSSQMGTLNTEVNMYSSVPSSENTDHVLGEKYYSLSNHLGNVLTVISDQKIPLDQNNDMGVDGFLASIVNVSDYSPFGVELDGRTVSSGEYRYGFNSMEKENELKGAGNSYNFGARMLDPRIGRWFAIDPRENEESSIGTYTVMNNSPIQFIDPDGEKVIVPMRLNGGFFGWFKVRMQMAYRAKHDPVYAAQLRSDKNDNNLHVYWSTEHKGNGNGQYSASTWRSPTIQTISQGQIEHFNRYRRNQKRLTRRANREGTGSPQFNYEYRPVDYVLQRIRSGGSIPNSDGQSIKSYQMDNGTDIRSFRIIGNNQPAPDHVQVVDANNNILFDTRNDSRSDGNGRIPGNYDSGVINVPGTGSPNLTVLVNGTAPQPNSRFNYNIFYTGTEPRASTTSKEGRIRGRAARRAGQIPNFERL